MRPTQKTSKSNETNTKDLHPALDKRDLHKRHLNRMRPTQKISKSNETNIKDHPTLDKCVHKELHIK